MMHDTGEAALSGLSVLILEDEDLLRRRLAANVERLGPDVTPAQTVDAARRLAKDLDFDFALLDVNLPDGRGIDLLKEGTFRLGTGVIVMTAQGGIEGAVEAMRLGALDCLTKPFDPAALLLVMRRARTRSSTSNPAPTSAAPRGGPTPPSSCLIPRAPSAC